MIHKIHVQKFKAFLDEKIEFSPLTVLTGTNSSGKSTLLQAVMLLETSPPELSFTKSLQDSFRTGLNTNEPAASPISISGEYEGNATSKICCQDGKIDGPIKTGGLPGRTFFVAADRVGPYDDYPATHSNAPENDFGQHCNLAWHFFNSKKNKPPYKELIHKKAPSDTLSGQVNYWLNHIVGTEIATEGSETEIKVRYRSLASDDHIAATQTGFGTSTLFPVILAPLLASKGDRVIIENPEIHLHPQAQARLADLFVFAANAGVQIIVETHCEHLIYSLCSKVHSAQLKSSDLVFYYKGQASEPFQCIKVNERGRFISTDGELRGFPQGFFDATLNEYLAIY
jgi:predicted ATPase